MQIRHQHGPGNPFPGDNGRREADTAKRRAATGGSDEAALDEEAGSGPVDRFACPNVVQNISINKCQEALIQAVIGLV